MKNDYDYIGVFVEGLAKANKGGHVPWGIYYNGSTVSVRGSHQGGKWGFVDSNQKEVVPLVYDEVFDFENGMARVFVAGKYGVVDKLGREVVAPEYEMVDRFSGGMARIVKNGKEGFVSATGQVVVAPQYAFVENFNAGVARVMLELGGKSGLVNRQGQLILPVECEFVGGVVNGKIEVRRNGEVFFVDTQERGVQ